MASEKGVVIRYQGSKVHCKDCVRITVGTSEENDELLKTLKKTIAELDEAPNGSVWIIIKFVRIFSFIVVHSSASSTQKR